MHDDGALAEYRNGRPPGTGHFVLRSEFAIVGIDVRSSGGRHSLRVEDLRTGVSVELDPLELESLAWAQHSDLATLLDPGRTRWQSERVEAAGTVANPAGAHG